MRKDLQKQRKPLDTLDVSHLNVGDNRQFYCYLFVIGSLNIIKLNIQINDIHNHLLLCEDNMIYGLRRVHVPANANSSSPRHC